MCLSVPIVQAVPSAQSLRGPLSSSIAADPASAGAGAAALQELALARLATRAEESIALSVALPYCSVHCLCCDRDIRAGQTPGAMHTYAQHLCQEVDLLAEHIGGSRELMQLHLGGGSANLFSASSLVALMQRLRHHWRVPCDADLSVECDPRSVGWVQLELLRGLGFEQLQFGVFDLDPRVQQAIGRIQSAALVDDACSLARSCGITGIRLGLMVGLPGQTMESWRDTLRQVIAIAPERINLSRYRHRPGQTAGQCAIDAHALPGPSEVIDLVALSAEDLGAVGYRWVGADLFVLEDDPLAVALDADRLRISLLGYTDQPAMPQLGVGRGAVTDLDGCVFWNESAPQAWQAEVSQGRLPVAQVWQADAQASRRRTAAEHLLCRQQLPAALLADELAPLYEALLQQSPAGSLQRQDDHLLVTPAGRANLHRLCADLAGLPARPGQPLPAWLH